MCNWFCTTSRCDHACAVIHITYLISMWCATNSWFCSICEKSLSSSAIPQTSCSFLYTLAFLEVCMANFLKKITLCNPQIVLNIIRLVNSEKKYMLTWPQFPLLWILVFNPISYRLITGLNQVLFRKGTQQSKEQLRCHQATKRLYPWDRNPRKASVCTYDFNSYSDAT